MIGQVHFRYQFRLDSPGLGGEAVQQKNLFYIFQPILNQPFSFPRESSSLLSFMLC